jgi:hypothetical protein
LALELGGCFGKGGSQRGQTATFNKAVNERER